MQYRCIPAPGGILFSPMTITISRVAARRWCRSGTCRPTGSVHIAYSRSVGTAIVVAAASSPLVLSSRRHTRLVKPHDTRLEMQLRQGRIATRVQPQNFDSQRSAVLELAAELERLCDEAEEALAIDPPGATWLPEGCEGAPPEVMAQLVAMTAGAGKFPVDTVVDALWDELARDWRSK